MRRGSPGHGTGKEAAGSGKTPCTEKRSQRRARGQRGPESSSYPNYGDRQVLCVERVDMLTVTGAQRAHANLTEASAPAASAPPRAYLFRYVLRPAWPL